MTDNRIPPFGADPHHWVPGAGWQSGAESDGRSGEPWNTVGEAKAAYWQQQWREERERKIEAEALAAALRAALATRPQPDEIKHLRRELAELADYAIDLLDAFAKSPNSSPNFAAAAEQAVDRLSVWSANQAMAGSAIPTDPGSPTPDGLRRAADYYASRPGADVMLRAAADRLEAAVGSTTLPGEDTGQCCDRCHQPLRVAASGISERSATPPGDNDD